MIGNDIPGLKYLFETEKIGVCYSKYKPEIVAEAIRKVDQKYEELSSNAFNYYMKCDYGKLLSDILDDVYQ